MNFGQGELWEDPGDEIPFQKPTARHDNIETSWEAAHDAEFHASEGRIAALRALAVRPMTDYELAEHTHFQQNSIGKRRLDCQRAGLVEVWRINGVKQKRPGPTGSMCFVWTLTSQGVAYENGLD